MSGFHLLAALLLVVCAPSLIAATSFKDCGSKVGKLLNASVTNCQEKVCILKKGTNVTFQVQFISDEKVTATKAVVYGLIREIPVYFPLPNSDGCKNSGLTCPLVKGKTYNYHSIIEIKSEYPVMELVVKWQLQDQKEVDIFCVEIGAKIVNA